MSNERLVLAMDIQNGRMESVPESEVVEVEVLYPFFCNLPEKDPTMCRCNGLGDCCSKCDRCRETWGERSVLVERQHGRHSFCCYLCQRCAGELYTLAAADRYEQTTLAILRRAAYAHPSWHAGVAAEMLAHPGAAGKNAALRFMGGANGSTRHPKPERSYAARVA